LQVAQSIGAVTVLPVFENQEQMMIGSSEMTKNVPLASPCYLNSNVDKQFPEAND